MNKNRLSKLQISYLSNKCWLMQIYRLRFYNANELMSRFQGHCWRDFTTELFILFNFCTNSQLALRRILLVLKSEIALHRFNRLGCSKNIHVRNKWKNRVSWKLQLRTSFIICKTQPIKSSITWIFNRKNLKILFENVLKPTRFFFYWTPWNHLLIHNTTFISALNLHYWSM